MGADPWAALAEAFVDGAYATVKGRVRTAVLHRQLLGHLPPPPASILDVGAGAGHQSSPLARLGYEVTMLDSSPAMLARAAERLAAEPGEVRSRVRLVEADGVSADRAGRRFDAVLCHGVLMYEADPAPLVATLCRCVRPGGVMSLMALNAHTMAVRPALDGRWADALAALEEERTVETGVLGAETRADTVDGLSALLRAGGVETEEWYGVWLFSDWRDLPLDTTDVRAVAEVEYRAAGRDPYRQLSRVFHLVGRSSAG